MLGPGLRWGVMGNMMLNHLGGGPGGIEHFFQQFTGPMTAWWKTLGSPVLTPEVQKKLIDSVHAEVGSRTVEELEAERDEILLGLLELRAKRPDVDPHKSQPSSEAAAVLRATKTAAKEEHVCPSLRSLAQLKSHRGGGISFWR